MTVGRIFGNKDPLLLLAETKKYGHCRRQRSFTMRFLIYGVKEHCPQTTHGVRPPRGGSHHHSIGRYMVISRSTHLVCLWCCAVGEVNIPGKNGTWQRHTSCIAAAAKAAAAAAAAASSSSSSSSSSSNSGGGGGIMRREILSPVVYQAL